MTVINPLDIQTTLLSFINDELYEDGTEVDLHDDLLLEIEMDSLTLLRLIGFIEKEFAISINPAQVTIVNFKTVEIISQFLANLLAQECALVR
jgi:acyl carrier protein